MYPSLQSIGLKLYLDEYFFNEEHIQERWLTKLDAFVENLSDDQKLVLKEKFKSNLPHLSKNDLLHEIMVACAFYPQAKFNGGAGPDLVDGNICIEIKTINTSPIEVERVKNLVPNSTRYSIPKDGGFEKRIESKFDFRFKKAIKQINHDGTIIIVWDSDLVVRWESRKRKIETLLKTLVEREKPKESKVIVKTIFFGDLRELLAK